ncbi:MAG: molybdopterin cofactor-binding domain-containing protein, partial [Bacteroidota bacterium]
MSETNTTKKKGMTRRKFLVGSSIGFGVLLGAGYFGRHAMRRYVFEMADTIDLTYSNSAAPNVWFEITADNQVTLHSPKVEMGQGTFTGLAQIAADELEVDISQIRVVHAATSTGSVDPFSTGGSNSISGLWQPLRELAATMREMLKTEAAGIMGVDASTLTAANGVISGGNNSMTYGEVVAQVESWNVPDTPPLKDIKDYKFVGQPVPRLDLVDKVVGTPIFGMDATMPAMLYGAVVRPDKVGARYVSADTTEAEQMPGVVQVVKEDDFVGVVATSRMAAERAKEAIKVTWDVERTWETRDIEAMIRVGEGTPIEIQRTGNPASMLAHEGVITAEYTSPIAAHAQIEPNGALAYVEDDRATVVISTQVVSITRSEVAERLGMDEEQVDVKPAYLGGGFGRRLHTPNAIQAAVLSKAVGKPVKCFFNRKEEFQNDTFRPPTHHVMKARLSATGMIEALEHNVSSGDVMFGSALVPSAIEPILGADIGAWRGGMIQYRGIPHFSAISWRVKLPFATSFWRSLGLLANTFAIESFMDELAIAAGKDPVQFRLEHIQDDARGDRLKAVIQAAAEQGVWRDGVHDGRAMGFAASTDANTPVAHVVEVSVEGKEIKVHKVTCAIDPGLAVNPDQVRAQSEGAIIMGLSGTLYEKMEVRDGVLYPTIYGPYKMALMRHVPKDIDVVILENAEKPGAVGEP